MKKIGLVFPGQGSQYIGMGRELYNNFSVAKQLFEEASEVLGFSLMDMCFDGDIKDLTKTENTQPAILTASVAAYEVFMQEIGVKPAVTAGHSLGEYTALVCAGAMRFTDAVSITRQRGLFMQQAVPLGVGAMAAISGVDNQVVEEECKKASIGDKIAVISNYNSLRQIVISGHKESVSKVCEILKERGVRVIPLNVSAPFHSPLMNKASDKLRDELAKYEFLSLKNPVISNVSALPYKGPETIIDNLTQQIVKPVRWVETVKYFDSQDIDVAIEIGPKTVLGNLYKNISPSVKIFSYDKSEDRKAIERLNTNFKSSKGSKYPNTVVTRALAIAICTQNRNWNNDEYEKGVIEPYKEVKQMQELLERDNLEPNVTQMEKALEMLKSVFLTKKVPLDEQKERFNQIFDETNTRELFSARFYA